MKFPSNTLYINSYFIYESVIRYMSNSHDVGLNTIFRSNASIFTSLSKKEIDEKQNLLRILFKNRIIGEEEHCTPSTKFVFLWGAKLSKIDKAAMIGVQRKCKLYFIEDSFLRSIIGSIRETDKKYSTSFSFTIDDKCPHYDASTRSRLEKIIQQTGELDSDDLERINILIKNITSNYISKYNHQPIYISPHIGIQKKKVLIALQSFNDASVNISGGDTSDFIAMLNDAIQENPDADILIKMHPDTLIKRNRSYLEAVSSPNVYFIDFDINPISIIDYVDKVYVYSSQIGLEALLCGKEVHVYGTPCYAGWGLTKDIRSFPRRKQKKSIQQLVKSIYVDYPLYFDPQTALSITPEATVQHLTKLRNEYFFEKRYSKHVLIIKLDGIGDYIIFRNFCRALRYSKYYKDAKITLLCDSSVKDFASYLDNDFFHDFIFVNRRANKILNILIKLKITNSKNKILKVIWNKYIKYLFRHVIGRTFDTVIVSCYNKTLQIIINDFVKYVNAKAKFASAIFGTSPKLHKKLYNFMIPIYGDNCQISRLELERSLFENIICQKLDSITTTIPIQEINPEKSVVLFVDAFHSNRQWGIENFLKLSKSLIETHDLTVYMLGNINLSKYSDFTILNSDNFINLTGQASVDTLINTIKKSKFIITCDTFAYHLSIALQKDTFVISNGNSYFTFLLYKHIHNIQYIFPQQFKFVLSSNDIQQLRSTTLRSSYDINSIAVNDVITVINRYLIKTVED